MIEQRSWVEAEDYIRITAEVLKVFSDEIDRGAWLLAAVTDHG